MQYWLVIDDDKNKIIYSKINCQSYIVVVNKGTQKTINVENYVVSYFIFSI